MGWFRRVVLGAGQGYSSTPVQRLTAGTGANFEGITIPPELLEAMLQGGNIAPRVSREQALQVPAVLRARNLIVATLASLPMNFHDKLGNISEITTLLKQIDPDIANIVTMAQTYEDLLFESVAWWRVVSFDGRGFPNSAVHVPHSSVHVAGTGDLPAVSRISSDIPFPVNGQVYIDGAPVPDHEIIRFDSPNPPLLVHAARAIRQALNLDKTAARYADDLPPLGYFTDLDGEEPLTEDEAQAAIDRWREANAKRTWGYVGGLKAETLQFDAEQIQLADQRQHAVLEIARATGIDPEDLGVSVTSRTYQNGETRKLFLLDFNLNALLTTVEQRLSMGDVTPRGYVARAKLNGFLRSDSLTRMNTYKVGLEVGAYADKDEVRAEEGKPPLTRAQKDSEAIKDAAVRDLTEPDPEEDDDMANQNGKVESFAAGESAEIHFDAPEMASTFRVNKEKRTISGLIIPWGQVANNGIAKWRFTKGSLHWTDPSRVKLNLHHDHTQAFAKAVRVQDTPSGLDASFQVARGAEGDRALSLAEDGVLDGFSVEVYFDDEDAYEMDPNERGVRNVHNGWLRGVALTAMPAFDDARVTAVAATQKQKGATNVEPEDSVDASATFEAQMTALAGTIAESHTKLTAGLAESIGESVSAGIKNALETITAPQDGPQPVRAARYTVTREAPIYSLNGAGPSLVKDAWYSIRERDDDAIERLRKYRAQQGEMAKLASQMMANQVFSAQFAPQGTSALPEVIPPGYRPDLYVPELMKGRPLVGACSRGTIANATPFLVPVFTSSTGATADHVEGTNPSDGSMALDEKTVTPGAISGRLVLTREIVDSSNPAIDQIALATMRESYSQQTEAKVYTMLNGANGVGGVITAGLVPSGAQAATVNVTAVADNQGKILVRALRTALAKYPFLRFAAPTDAVMSQEATVYLADAVDTTGRPLLPSIAPQNAGGLGNAVTQGWSIDGLPHRPAWAMTGTADGDAQVITLNQSDVWVWESPLLTFRFEEKQGPANIEFNLFSYFGTHVLRPVGLSGMRITAV